MSEHPSYRGRLSQATTAAAERPVPPEPADAYPMTRRYSDRACCCAAEPAVIAVMPPRGARQGATELLLCWHHYRASKAGLAAAGATTLDMRGRQLDGDDWLCESR
jgi:hypothetical protein